MDEYIITPDLIVIADECGDSLWESVLSQTENRHNANEPNNLLFVPTAETNKIYQ